REERDPDRKRDLTEMTRDAHASERVEIDRQKARIFEPGEEREVDRHKENEGVAVSLALQGEAAGIVDGDADKQDQRRCTGRPVVEEETDNEDGRRECTPRQ